MHERKQRSAVRFGPFVLDFEAGLLLRAGEPIHLRRKSHVLLAFLAGNAGRVVSKDELLAAVWPGVHVTEDSLTQSVHEIRKALGGGEQFLRTVSGRGYVLVADPVRPPRRSALLLFDGFTAGDDADAALAARLSDTIRAMLTKFAQLSVRSGPAPPRETDGIYRLEGRICVAGDIPVLQIDLTDAETAATLWSHKTEGAPEADWNEACNRIVCRLLGRVNDAELQRVARKVTDDLDARDLTLKGIATRTTWKRAAVWRRPSPPTRTTVRPIRCSRSPA